MASPVQILSGLSEGFTQRRATRSPKTKNPRLVLGGHFVEHTQALRRKRRKKMGSRLGRRVIHFANLPIKLQMPTTLDNIREISLKTVPSASKIEIKRVLESLYGFDVDKVTTLNMEGKKKKRGGILLAKPDYKKAYVTLRTPLSLPRELYPVKIVEEDRKATSEGKKMGKKSSVVEDGEARRPKHWLDGDGGDGQRRDRQRRDGGVVGRNQGGGGGSGGGGAKFPWSFMKSRDGKS